MLNTISPVSPQPIVMFVMSSQDAYNLGLYQFILTHLEG